jgi:cell division septum initiation protein DivIVA
LILHESPGSYSTGGDKPKPQTIIQVRRYEVFPVKRLTSREEVDNYLDGIRQELYKALEENDGIQII